MNNHNIESLDKILLCGDKLYRKIRTENDFLQIHEVGCHITEFGNTYKLSIDKEFLDVRQVSVGTSLEHASYLAYAGGGKLSSTCVLCVGNEKGGSASLLFLCKGICYVFDPHSRNNLGLPSSNGTSVVISFKSRQSLISYIRLLHPQYGSDVKQECHLYTMCSISFRPANEMIDRYFVDQRYQNFCATTFTNINNSSQSIPKTDVHNSDGKQIQTTSKRKAVARCSDHNRKRDIVKQRKKNNRELYHVTKCNNKQKYNSSTTTQTNSKDHVTSIKKINKRKSDLIRDKKLNRRKNS